MKHAPGRPRHYAIVLVAALALASCASLRGSGDLHRHEQVITCGKTTRAEVLAAFGDPSEITRDGEREVWVYGDASEFPAFVGFVPIVGELVAIVEVASALNGRHELIIQFDRQGVASKSKLRRRD